MRHKIAITDSEILETHTIGGSAGNAIRVAAIRRGFPLLAIENGAKISWSQTRLPTGGYILAWDDGEDSDFVLSIKEAIKGTERGYGYRIASALCALTAWALYSLVIYMYAASGDNSTLTKEQDDVVTELCKANKQCLPLLSKEQQKEFNNRKSSTK